MEEPNKTLCERRTTCKHNNEGVCSLKEPRIDKRQAYASCLDQELKKD